MAVSRLAASFDRFHGSICQPLQAGIHRFGLEREAAPPYLAIGKYVAVDSEPMTPSPAELVSTLSIASELGMGRPVERVLRQTVIAMRFADVAGVDPAVRAAVYLTGMIGRVDVT